MLVANLQFWKAQVLQRDNYTCQKCGSHEKLEAHHFGQHSWVEGCMSLPNAFYVVRWKLIMD